MFKPHFGIGKSNRDQQVATILDEQQAQTDGKGNVILFIMKLQN